MIRLLHPQQQQQQQEPTTITTPAPTTTLISTSIILLQLCWSACPLSPPPLLLDSPQVVWSPIWNASYILLLGLMKREALGDVWRNVRTTAIPLITSGLKLWPAAHIITYGLIPVENRLLWVDLVEILWVTILSRQAAKAEEKAIADMKEGEAAAAVLPAKEEVVEKREEVLR